LGESHLYLVLLGFNFLWKVNNGSLEPMKKVVKIHAVNERGTKLYFRNAGENPLSIKMYSDNVMNLH
jgi:hypothetical protein